MGRNDKKTKIGTVVSKIVSRKQSMNGEVPDGVVVEVVEALKRSGVNFVAIDFDVRKRKLLA